jgi:DNA-binding FadR family transcriptional regulator
LTVAREVMLALQNKGLVQGRPRRGITVLPRDSWDLLDADVLLWHDEDLGPIIADLEESRELIEPWAARTAAQSGSEADIALCREAMEKLAEATGLGDTAGMTTADLAFHRALLKASGNSVILQIGRVIEPVLKRRDELTMHDRKKEDLTFLPLHEEIVAAMERRDPAGASAAALRLIRESGTDSAEALKQ